MQYDRRFRKTVQRAIHAAADAHNQGLVLRIQEATSGTLNTLPDSKSPHRDVLFHSTLPPVKARGSRYDRVCQAQAFV